ncbi:MAG: hypothetical protein JSV20_03080 [Candidatus Bathyarchaeota archaeon]|nr:MAG: hypothetical protein JSV20_03080 [Candidatus Bathyarchaeota archaeon]
MSFPFFKLRENKKGGTSLAIAIIMALVVLSAFIQNIVIWGQTLAAEDTDRLNEQIDIEAVYFLDGQLNIMVRNTGEVTAHLVALWINDTRYMINYYLNVEESVIGIGEDLIFAPMPNMNSNQIVTVFTERGNSGTTTYTLGEASEQVFDVGESGVFKVDWFYSKYTSQRYPDPQEAITISKWNDLYVAFYINVTNQWIYPCTITEDSFLTLTSLSTIGATEEPIFYLVKNVTYGVNPTLNPYKNDDSPYTVYPNCSQVLTFAAYGKWSDWNFNGTWKDWKWGPSCFTQPQITEGAGIQISLFYSNATVPEGKIFGQTVSTQACILLDDK